MAKDEAQFGFTCGEFSVVKSGNDIILPGSNNAPLRKSLLPYSKMDDIAGGYRLRAVHAGEIICDIPVQVVWVSHQSQPGAFLGLRCQGVDDLIACLKVHVGKSVELSFTRRR